MAPVSAMLHNRGICMLRYLDDWLVLARFHQEAIQARDEVLLLCSQLGIVVNLEKIMPVSIPDSHISRDGLSKSVFEGFPDGETSRLCFETYRRTFKRQSVVIWRCLLCRLSFLCHLVPAGRLRMQSLQLQLRQHWDFVDEDAKIADFLFFLSKERGLSVSSIKGFRPMLSSVFKFWLPDIQEFYSQGLNAFI